MSGFQLQATTLENPEKFRRNSRRRLVSPQKFNSILDPLKEGGSTPTFKQAMVQKAISDFLAPSAAHVATEPQVELGDTQFELKLALINMVQANPFCGKSHEDANAHLNTSWRCVAPLPSRESQ